MNIEESGSGVVASVGVSGSDVVVDEAPALETDAPGRVELGLVPHTIGHGTSL